MAERLFLRNRKLTAAALTLLAADTVAAAQQTAIWNGSFNGSWSHGFNWSTGTIPNNTASLGYDVRIDGGKLNQSNPLCNGSFSIDRLTVDQQDQLFITSGGSLSVAESVNLTGRVIISNVGTLVLQDGATLGGSGSILLNINSSNNGNISLNLLPLGAFTLPAGFLIESAYNSTIGNPATPFINSGTLFSSGSTATVQASQITNNATITVGQRGAVLLASPTVVNAGTLITPNSLTFTGGGTVIVNAPSISNSGLMSAQDRARFTCNGPVINTGTILAISGATFTAMAPVNNQGTIIVSTGGTLRVAAGWTNPGTILVNNATIGLGSTFDKNTLSAITFQRFPARSLCLVNTTTRDNIFCSTAAR
jgi:hypothetical protein